MRSMNYIKKIILKWGILIKIMPLLILILVAKILVDYYNLEFLELNSLFTSLVAATIFLIGFLISGVLSDYKESERIPSDLTASLKNLQDDALMLSKVKHVDSIGYLSAIRFLEYQKIVAFKIRDWLYREITSEEMIKIVSDMNTYFIELDAEGVQANYIIKMKNEQNNLRKIILRIDTIRNTDFISSAYAIVESMAFIISIGLVFINIEAEKQNLFAEVFFTLLVSFLIFYMIALIKDIDDPFDYKNNGESGSEINLDVFNDHLKSLK